MPKIYGLPACSCLDSWLPVFVKELDRFGIRVRFTQLNGSYGPSAGTHKGGAFDLVVVEAGDRSLDAAYDTVVRIARSMGADATWERPYNWDRRRGIRHIHGLLTGCSHLSWQAKVQQTAVKANRNGLANLGRDTGRRPLSKRTYKQGIAWAKARQKPKPKPVAMTTTTVDVLLHNMSSDKGNWIKVRSPRIAARIKAFAPDFVSAVELYATRRPTLSRLITRAYKTIASHYGKVQYVHRKSGWSKVRTKKYSLGNGKHGLATRYRHPLGGDFVLATAHFSHEHDDSAKRIAESRKLMAYLERDFPNLPLLVTGDFNDSHKATSSRRSDSSGKVLKADGLHDLYYDVPNESKTNPQYNTANGFKVPPTKDRVHLDRFFGTDEFEGLSWYADVQPADDSTTPYPADHWAIRLKVRLTHPKK